MMTNLIIIFYNKFQNHKFLSILVFDVQMVTNPLQLSIKRFSLFFDHLLGSFTFSCNRMLDFRHTLSIFSGNFVHFNAQVVNFAFNFVD